MNVPSLIEQVVVNMRGKGSYVGASNVGTTWTIVSKNSLKSGEWVDIGSASYQIVTATPTQFTFETEDAVPANGSWTAKAPFFDFGDRIEINSRLVNMKSEPYRYWKYPLIMLRLPYGDRQLNSGLHQFNLNVLIVMYTDKSYNSRQRYNNVIVPVLEPLFESFLKHVRLSGLFSVSGAIEHTRVDRLFWGSSDRPQDRMQGNIASVFSDPLDAIELIDLKLNVINNKCI